MSFVLLNVGFYCLILAGLELSMYTDIAHIVRDPPYLGFKTCITLSDIHFDFSCDCVSVCWYVLMCEKYLWESLLIIAGHEFGSCIRVVSAHNQLAPSLLSPAMEASGHHRCS